MRTRRHARIVETHAPDTSGASCRARVDRRRLNKTGQEDTIMAKTYECEMCCKKGATIRRGDEAFLGAVCDDCYTAVMTQGEDTIVKTHDILVRVGRSRAHLPMLQSEIIAAGRHDRYLDIVDDADAIMRARAIDNATVYMWNGFEYEVSEWIEVAS
jgi:hypothetical protein